jgi:hypothetical protein
MFINNLKDNCKLVDVFMSNDLELNTLILDENNQLNLEYNNTTLGSSSITIKTDKILQAINVAVPSLSPDTLYDVWLPAIIKNDDWIDNREVINSRLLDNTVLGIEDFIKISSPKLKHFNIEQGSDTSYLGLDWCLGNNLSAYELEYGILFWYKKRSTNYLSGATFLIKDIPQLTRVTPTSSISYTENNDTLSLNSNDYAIKLDDNTLKLSDNKIFKINKLTSQQIENLLFKIIDYNNTIKDDIKDYSIWIANGDTYSYFLNPKDKKYRLEHNHSPPYRPGSRSYLSPSLSHIYRQIYHSLTINRPKSFINLLASNEERLVKLCYSLASAPLIDKVSIDYLQSSQIEGILNDYFINNAFSTTDTEITNLLNTIAKINQLYKPLNINVNKQTLSNSYINNKKDLYNKLMSKYLAGLKMSVDTVIKYKKPLSQGSQAYLDIQLKTYASKTHDENQDIYNNFVLKVGNIQTETLFSSDQSILKISEVNNSNKNQIIPCADIADRKRKTKSYFSLGPDIVVQKVKPSFVEETYRFRMPEEQDNILDDNLISIDSNYLWSVAHGQDNIRFDDAPRYGTRGLSRRLQTSTDPEPAFFIKQTGLYTLECSKTVDSIQKKIDRINLYVTNLNNEYAPGKSPPTVFDHEYDVTFRNVKCLVPNIRKIAINKRGLIWFIDTDIRVKSTSTKADKLINIKVPTDLFTRQDAPATPLESDGICSLEFKPNNTIMRLDRLSIENMRDTNYNNCQCKSFFEERLQRANNTFGDTIFSARYSRRGREPDALILTEVIREGDGYSLGESFTYYYPAISTVYAPPVLSYGGYSQEVIDTIGVEIPFHPVKDSNNQTIVNRKLSENLVWGGTEQSGEFKANNPAHIPILSEGNDFGGANPGYRCHLINIPITGHTTFNKGYFHPSSGWYSYNSTEYNTSGKTIYSSLNTDSGANITSVKKYKPGRYGSYIFKGCGIFGMRTSRLDNSIVPTLYQSSIKIVNALEPGSDGSSSTFSETHPHYGTRNLNGLNIRKYQSVDDFIVEDGQARADFYYGENHLPQIVYGFLSTSMDTMTIKDIEIKINNINYPNPKNLVFALEVRNDAISDMTDLQMSKILINYKTQQNITGLDNTDVIDYINTVRSFHQNSDPDTLTIYFFNQEHIDNYGYNFSFISSDNSDKSIVFYDENSISRAVKFNQKIINNNESISPVCSINNYNDKDNAIYKYLLKENIGLEETCFAKFKNIPIKNTTFILKVFIIGSEQCPNALDQTVNNSSSSGLSGFYNKEMSNSTYNSICSWDLILHTTNISKFDNSSILGMFDYKNPSTLYGYNYIANFTNKTYMLPRANLNAPYQFYIGGNKCQYTNNDEASRPLYYPASMFPSTTSAWTPFATLAGAMNAIWQMNYANSIGGWSDPLTSYLWTLQFNAYAQLVEREYFQPIYRYAGFGESYKANIIISKDKALWYKLEATIFKYQNSPILSKNKFNYIKPNKQFAKAFSIFAFNKIIRFDDIFDEDDIAISFKEDIADKSGLIVTLTDSSTVTLQKNDLIRLEAQTNSNENGIYIVKEQLWELCGDSNITRNIKLLSNTLFHKIPTLYNQNNIESSKIVILSDNRASHHFDIGDSIIWSDSPEFISEDTQTVTIQDKIVIYTKGAKQTILCLSNAIDKSKGFISKEAAESDLLIIYKTDTTYLDDTKVGKWGLYKSRESTNPKNTYYNKPSVAVAEGSYGYGTDVMDAPIISQNTTNHKNSIDQTYQQFNNNINNKFKFNNIFIKQFDEANTVKEITFSDSDDQQDLLRCYPYGLKDIDYIFNPESSYIWITGNDPQMQTKLQNLKMLLDKNTLQTDISDMYFLDIKSNKFKTEITCNSGEIILENDYIMNHPIVRLTEDQKTQINDRINIIDSQSIPDVISFYDAAPEDPIACLDATQRNNTSIACPKKEAKQKIASLYAERYELSRCLDLDLKTPSGVLPIFETTLETNATTNRITPKYTEKDYYWINVDPNQWCSISEEALPRILKSVEFDCVTPSRSESLYIGSCASVCDNRKRVATELSGSDETYMPESSAAGDFVLGKYVNNKIEEEKAQYPMVSEWVNENFDITLGRRERTFFLSCNDTVGGNLQIKDVLVRSFETFIYPKIDKLSGFVKDVINLDDSQELYVKIKNIPRKIKTLDKYYLRYDYDTKGNIAPSLEGAAIGGPMNCGFPAWVCIGVDDEGSDTTTHGNYIETPDFFKMQNEMIFRAFFGSIDGIEHKNTNIVGTKEFWEWIPYEYYNS